MEGRSFSSFGGGFSLEALFLEMGPVRVGGIDGEMDGDEASIGVANCSVVDSRWEEVEDGVLELGNGGLEHKEDRFFFKIGILERRETENRGRLVQYVEDGRDESFVKDGEDHARVERGLAVGRVKGGVEDDGREEVVKEESSVDLEELADEGVEDLVDEEGKGMLAVERKMESTDDVNLKGELLRGVCVSGFEKSSTVQQRVIDPCLKQMDVITLVQSGTGKTAIFAISVLERTDVQLRGAQALIFAMTRELASQIQKVMMSLGDCMGDRCESS